MVRYAPPTLGSLSTNSSPFKLNPNIQNIPGVKSEGATRGAPVAAPTSDLSSSVGQVAQQITPLDAFRTKIQEQIKNGSDYNTSLIRTKTRTGYNSTYGSRRNNMTWSGNNTTYHTGYSGAKSNYGGYRNGQLPASALSAATFQRGVYLQPRAMSSLERMNNAFRNQFGYSLGITDSYRSLAEQYSLKSSKPRLAATPGRSVHGLGLALDINVRSPGVLSWLNANARQFGWVNPNWAKTSKYEPWHWEYVG